MFKLSEVKELIKLIDQSSLQELEIQNDNYRLAIRKPVKSEVLTVAAAPAGQAYIPAPTLSVLSEQLAAPSASAPVAVPAAEPDTSNLHRIVSPMVGTFYQSPAPDSPVFVNIGSKVTEKSVVCIVEAMKLMNEIEAEVKGEIVEILVDNGQLVEYGQPLFLVKK
ncbi:acetyl-CoA carboxylase biotin carboxyl carrier protein [Gorillibacterium massiliense]|uniref:acetyl-CoA carboxylase biotin carboxyl carrier protein n=1 Tax=Gorillibacterium massiliense TaxID=1280390 RepID=UPI000594274C|nr:acetyl-CoA carboxylase biotin carboxyl carrier protein [Gorillibacterium massiliense]